MKTTISIIMAAILLTSCATTYKAGANYHPAKVNRADVHRNGGCAWTK